MSVYKRFRKETNLQFLITGLELQINLTKFIMSEKHVPKKYRLLIGAPIIAKVDEIIDNLTFANAIFPSNEELLQIRNKDQTSAIANCYQLHNKLIRLEKCVDSVKVNNLSNIIELLNNEVGLIKRWKKSDKVLKKETSE